jgi:hypothetical protein
MCTWLSAGKLTVSGDSRRLLYSTSENGSLGCHHGIRTKLKIIWLDRCCLEEFFFQIFITLTIHCIGKFSAAKHYKKLLKLQKALENCW